MATSDPVSSFLEEAAKWAQRTIAAGVAGAGVGVLKGKIWETPVLPVAKKFGTGASIFMGSVGGARAVLLALLDRTASDASESSGAGFVHQQRAMLASTASGLLCGAGIKGFTCESLKDKCLRQIGHFTAIVATCVSAMTSLSFCSRLQQASRSSSRDLGYRMRGYAVWLQ
jgi:hypothetical protein